MKRSKMMVCVICLAVLTTACSGKIRSKMSVPDQVPVVKIESVDPAIYT